MPTVDERILAQHAQHSPTDQEHRGSEERNCFYCLEGWVFLGSLDHDGEEIVEASAAVGATALDR
jgi:hypothetical protein